MSLVHTLGCLWPNRLQSAAANHKLHMSRCTDVLGLCVCAWRASVKRFPAAGNWALKKFFNHSLSIWWKLTSQRRWPCKSDTWGVLKLSPSSRLELRHRRRRRKPVGLEESKFNCFLIWYRFSLYIDMWMSKKHGHGLVLPVQRFQMKSVQDTNCWLEYLSEFQFHQISEKVAVKTFSNIH